MSTEVAQAETLLPNPITGEAISLGSRTDELARLIADIREAESQLREMKALASREVLNRMDKLVRWTLHFDGVDIEGESPEAGVTKEWDGEGLNDWLMSLVDGGELDLEAVEAAIEVIQSFKVHQRGINALRKAGFNVDQFCTETPRERRIKKVRVK